MHNSRYLLFEGKIGPIPSKDHHTRKIPLKDYRPVKYHWKVLPLPEISILLEFLTANFDLARFSTKQEYEMTLLPLADDQQGSWHSLIRF